MRAVGHRRQQHSRCCYYHSPFAHTLSPPALPPTLLPSPRSCWCHCPWYWRTAAGQAQGRESGAGCSASGLPRICPWSTCAPEAICCGEKVVGVVRVVARRAATAQRQARRASLCAGTLRASLVWVHTIVQWAVVGLVLGAAAVCVCAFFVCGGGQHVRRGENERSSAAAAWLGCPAPPTPLTRRSSAGRS